MHHICIIYASYMHHTCIIYASYMHHICITYASYMHRTCTIYASHVHHICIIHASYMHHICVARRSIGPTTHVVAADAATAGTVGGPKPHDLCFTVDVFGIACGCLRPRFPCKLTTLRFSCMAYMHRIHASMPVCIYAYMHHICIIYASGMHHICIRYV